MRGLLVIAVCLIAMVLLAFADESAAQESTPEPFPTVDVTLPETTAEVTPVAVPEPVSFGGYTARSNGGQELGPEFNIRWYGSEYLSFRAPAVLTYGYGYSLTVPPGTYKTSGDCYWYPDPLMNGAGDLNPLHDDSKFILFDRTGWMAVIMPPYGRYCILQSIATAG